MTLDGVILGVAALVFFISSLRDMIVGDRDWRISAIMSLLFSILLHLVPAPATAAPLTPWEPGASPCAGACSWEWAREQTGAPEGELRPLTIPAETPIGWMSYAVSGVAFGLLYHGRPTLRPLAAWGYPLGDGRWLVQIAECGNWAIVYLPGSAVAGLAEAVATSAPPRLRGVEPGSTPPRSPLPPGVIERPDDPRPEPPVLPVPVPLGGLLLAAALAGLFSWAVLRPADGLRALDEDMDEMRRRG